MRKVLDANGSWRPLGTIMPKPPAPADPRGATTTFHGRYRGAHNTGVPNKSALGTPRFGCVLSTPNQTYNDQHFVGFVEVRATGVVFNRCYFEARGDLFLFNATEETWLYDCDLNGGLSSATADVILGSVHAVRCHIWGGGQDSVGFGDKATFDDCYIHGNVPHYGTHSDNAQTSSGTGLGIRRCKLLAYDPVTNSPQNYNAAIELGVFNPGDPINGLDIIDNYVDGGGYTLNGSLNLTGITNVVISGNRWGRHGVFGAIVDAVKAVPPHGTYDAATNVYDDDGTPV